MDATYPWSILGIAPTVDEKAIRKAYALKLRETRPDENPAGFQALLEARDHALQERHYLVDDATDDNEDEVVQAAVDAHLLHGEPPSVRPASIVTHASAPPKETGSVLVIDSPELSPEEEGYADLEELLDDVGRQHPWRDLRGRWAAVFDALERAPFDDYFHYMHVVLSRLVEDLRGQAAADAAQRQPSMLPLGNRQLGLYADVLADLEERFQFLKQDTILFDYLDDDKAEELIDALTLAVGRTAAPQPHFRPAVNVEEIDMAYVEAAFGDDPKMREYYLAARKADRFPRAFSIVALLFPLPVALYYRLHGVAVFLGVVMALNLAFQTLTPRALYAPYVPLTIWVYIIVSIVLSLNWRRLRINAMQRKIQDLRAKGTDPLEIMRGLVQWGKPSKDWLFIGIAILALLSVVRIYARYG
jgi:hypothetical protein